MHKAYTFVGPKRGHDIQPYSFFFSFFFFWGWFLDPQPIAFDERHLLAHQGPTSHYKIFKK